MFAVLAFVAFIVAFICHLAGGGVTKYVEDAELLGFIFLAASFLWGGYPWRHS
jgi:hypothetical protein